MNIIIFIFLICCIERSYYCSDGEEMAIALALLRTFVAKE